MTINSNKFRNFFLSYQKYFFYFLCFLIPFIIFLRTMVPTTFGWDTTWFHIQVPLLYVGQTTGFPLAFLLGKLFSFIPIGTIAYRLNMFSAFFGGLTTMVLFMIINKIKIKEYYIAFISSIFFVLFKVFWYQNNRFEVYTLHTFLISLIMLAGLYWKDNKNDKFLYLYYFLIGLSLTNHPISLFLLPAFIIFPIYINWRLVLKLKKVLIAIAALFIPNLLYLYIPIRSLQGYGNVDTLPKFIDYVTGSEWKEQLGIQSWNDLLELFKGYLAFLKGDLTVLVMVVLFIGLIHMIIKQKKLLILIITLILLNFIPILLYVEPTDFYLVSIVIFLSVFFALGIYSIKEGSIFLGNKIIKSNLYNKIKFFNVNRSDKRKKVLRYIFLSIFIVSISYFPINAGVSNFEAMDKSNKTQVYEFWKDVVDRIEKNSILISNSKSAHVALYISKFESDRNIEVLRGVNENKMRGIVSENIDKKNIYYDSYNLTDLSNYYVTKEISDNFFWEDYQENLQIYRIEGIIEVVKIIPEEEIIELEYGKKTTLTYYLENNNKDLSIDINSMELRLPDLIKFVGMHPGGDMDVSPGVAQGAYMWTNGPYTIEPGERIVLTCIIQANIKTEDFIDFRVTSGNMYIEGPDVKVIVK